MVNNFSPSESMEISANGDLSQARKAYGDGPTRTPPRRIFKPTRAATMARTIHGLRSTVVLRTQAEDKGADHKKAG